MYLAAVMTNQALPSIGRKMGGRSYVSVLHARNKIADRMERDSQIRALVEALRTEVLRRAATAAPPG
jgi:chromosomal replication initiator protein